MSIQNNKVVFESGLKRQRSLVWLLGGIEVALTVVLGFVIATTKIFSPSADSASGVINKLSYQGKLTNASGTALGGTGTDYCFRFSIYDAVSGGNKLWPSGTPATNTISVVEGVFNAEVGTADALTYDMYPTSTSYLNVEVYTVTSTCTGGSWESLTPRQQILATGYSIAAENVYGDLLRTDLASSLVQIGTGGGVSSSSVEKLALDIANTGNIIGESCTANGTVWYNSSASNTQALACVNSVVVPFAGPLANGYYGDSLSAERVAGQMGAGTVMFQPMEVMAPFQFNRFVHPGIYSNTSNSSNSASLSLYIGLYSRNVSTMSLMSSTSQTYGVTASGTAGNYTLYAGMRNYTVGWTGTVGPGIYYLAMMSRTTTGGGAGQTWSNYLMSNANSNYSGNFSEANNASNQNMLGLGFFSVTSAAMPASVAFSQLNASGSVNLRPPVYHFINSI